MRNRLYELWGQKKTLRAWAERMKIKLATLRSRLRRGWDVERTLLTEVRRVRTVKGLTDDDRQVCMYFFEAMSA